jgi:hypothetical protein
LLHFGAAFVAFRDNAPAKRPAFNILHFGAVIALAHCNMFGTDSKAEWDTNMT